MNRPGSGIGVVLAVVLSLLGLAASGVLLQHHIAIEIGSNPVFNNVCSLGEHTSCDEMLTSEWGEVWGVPTAMWGAFYFALTTAWFVIVGRPERNRRWLQVFVILGTAAGGAASGFLDYVMFTEFDRLCPFCFATHVISWLLFLVSLFLWPIKHRQMPTNAAGQPAANEVDITHWQIGYPRLGHFFGVVLMTCAICLATWSTYHRVLATEQGDQYKRKWQTLLNDLQAAAADLDQQAREYDEAYERWQIYEQVYRNQYEAFLKTQQYDIPIGPDDPMLGDVDAPHTVVVFSDFQCPFCARLADVLHERLEQFPGRFRLVFKYFPMNRTCNSEVKTSLHKASCATAIVAEAARIVGGNEAFWEMHDALFEHQKDFSQDWVKETATELGVNNEDFWAVFNRTSSWELIREHVKQAAEVGVDSTPVLFFDGRRMSGWGDQHTWRYLLEVRDVLKMPAPDTTPATTPTTSPELFTQAAGSSDN